MTKNYRVVSVSKDGGATFSETWLEKQLVAPRGCGERRHALAKPLSWPFKA